MKILFILVSCLLAVVLSVLAVIVTTGVLPSKTDSGTFGASSRTNIAGVPVKAEVSIFSGQGKVVDDLVKGLKEQIARNEEKAAELEREKEALSLRISQMAELEKRLQVLQEEVNQSIVQIRENEETNFKKLADMYAKMEPESASSLLQKAAPDRAAKIISLIPERQAAAILNAAVGEGDSGTEQAAQWADAMRRMSSRKRVES